MNEERTLYTDRMIIILSYNNDGTVDKLIFREKAETQYDNRICISSKSNSCYPEKIYELLRECEIE